VSALGASASREPAHVVESITELTAELVRIPSRSGIDPYEPIIRHLERWLREHDLAPRRLLGPSGEPLALACDVRGAGPGPRYVFDACLDTAPFGDEAAWRYPPTSGVVVDGWLYGRGSSDCKAALAIFAHVAAALRTETRDLHGTLTLLFDADEHTGRFGGAKAFFGDAAMRADIAGVMIGYPGDDEVIVGSRGFLRARLTVHGSAGHTGGRRTEGNAVDKAAVLVRELTALPLPDASDGFPVPPKLTVTAIHGGEGFSVIPDVCTVNVDVRLVPTFMPEEAAALVRAAVREVDERMPSARATDVAFEESWPPYVLPPSSPLIGALTSAVAWVGARPIRTKIAGPSNIGNYLASLGIEATAGYGVRYRNLHGTDECVDVSTIGTVHGVYAATARALLTHPHSD
jgi:succinyl-diaminopimelate desuccinylase